MKSQRIMNAALKRSAALALALALCVCGAPGLNSALAATAYDVSMTAPVNQTVRFSAADFDKNDQTLHRMTITSLPAASSGRLLLNSVAPVADGDILTAADLSRLSFHPAKDFAGTAIFTWDGLYDTDDVPDVTGSVAYQLTAPKAQDMTIYVVKDQMYHGTLSATNPNGVAIRFVEAVSPAHGDVTVSGTTNAFSYKPDTGFVGEDSFRFTVTHGALSSTALVTVYVRDIAPPTAHDSKVTVTRGQSVTSNMHATENNTTGTVTSLTYRVVREPTKGKLTWNSSGVFTYTHSGTSLGDDTFDFVANNGFRDSNAATVTLGIELPMLTYQDMTAHWANKAAGSLGGANLVVGDLIKSLYYYRPSELMTRAEFVMFLNSIMEYPMSVNVYSAFADVTERHLIAPLNTAYENGVTTGTSEGGRRYFFPSRQITRIEAMRLVDNALKLNPQNYADIELNFSDGHAIPEWALQSVRNLIGYKIVTGHNGMLNPAGLMTRAEAAELLYKAYVERKR